MNVSWELIVTTINKYRPAVRMKWNGDDAPGIWTTWISMPVPGYIETGPDGPVPSEDVEWLGIDTSQCAVPGRLVPYEDWQSRMDVINAELNGILDINGSIARIRAGKVA